MNYFNFFLNLIICWIWKTVLYTKLSLFCTLWKFKRKMILKKLDKFVTPDVAMENYEMVLIGRFFIHKWCEKRRPGERSDRTQGVSRRAKPSRAVIGLGSLAAPLIGCFSCQSDAFGVGTILAGTGMTKSRCHFYFTAPSRRAFDSWPSLRITALCHLFWDTILPVPSSRLPFVLLAILPPLLTPPRHPRLIWSFLCPRYRQWRWVSAEPCRTSSRAWQSLLRT